MYGACCDDFIFIRGTREAVEPIIAAAYQDLHERK
jgi:hypothetical protein